LSALWRIGRVFLSITQPALATDVSGDQEQGGYVARGGVVFDSNFNGSSEARRASPICPDCQWRTTGMCHVNSPDEQVGFCGGIGASCPAGRWMVKVWRQVGDAPWEFMGTWCVSDGGFQTTEQVSARVQQESWAFLPPLQIGVQPKNPVPANVPLVVWVNQPTQFGPQSLDVGEVEVLVTATPEWVWQFGSGAGFTTTDPGAAWPVGNLRHTFRRAGSREVAVTANWRAWWQVEGGELLPVAEVLTQRATTEVDVRQARAVLKRGS
jgi:hypothetical protein